MNNPTPVGELYVLRLLQSASCFRTDVDGRPLVCGSPPCACAQSLLDEIAKPLRFEIEQLRGLVADVLALAPGNDSDKFELLPFALAEAGWFKRAQAAIAKAADTSADGWCRHCGCGNDALGYKHLPNCTSEGRSDATEHPLVGGQAV